MTKAQMEAKNLQLLERIKNGEEQCMNEMLEFNKPLILSIIKRYFFRLTKFLDLEEMIQEGRLGMYEAIKAYINQPNNDVKLSTYIAKGVYYSIHNVITQYKKERCLKSVSLYKRCKIRIERTSEQDYYLETLEDETQDVEDNVLTQYDRNNELQALLTILKQNVKPHVYKMFIAYYLSESMPTYEKLADEFHMTKQGISANIKRCLTILKNSVNSDVEVKKVAKKRNIILENANNPKVLDRIREIVENRLLDNQREVINKRYFSEGEMPTTTKVARDLCLTRECVHQIEVQALARILKIYEKKHTAQDDIDKALKDPIKAKRLKHFVRFKFTLPQQKLFAEIYMNEENRGLQNFEIAAKCGQANNYVGVVKKKALEMFTELDARFDLSEIPHIIYEILEVEEVDREAFSESLLMLEEKERNAIYDHYFLKIVSSYNLRSVDKLKKIYSELILEKHQEEQVC